MEATVESPTPAPATETLAAPATSAPSPSPVTSQRPTSFLEAFEQVAAKDNAAAKQAPDPTAPVAPTDPDSALHPSTEKKPGAPPEDRWPQILQNQRAKAKEEALTEWRQQYGWAEQIPVETMQTWTQTAQRMATDPVGFLTDYLQAWESNPTVQTALRSHAGRILAGGRGQPAVDLSPDVDVYDEQGRAVAKTFSADRVQAIVQHAVQEAIGKEVAPLKQESAARQAEQRRAQTQAQAAETRKHLEAQTDSVLTELDEILDGAVSKNDGAILEALNAAMAANPKLSAHAAALQVRKARIVPQLEQRAKSQVLDSLNKKAAGNTATGTGASAVPKRPTTPDELAEWMRARDTGAGR